MSEHNTITDPDIHEPKGASTATAGQVYAADGAGSGAWEAPAAGPSTVTTVESASDFPTPVAGVITLAANHIYQINTSVNIGSDRFVFSDNSILEGFTGTVSGITSTTTGPLITGTGATVRVANLSLTATSASSLIAFDGLGTKNLLIEGITSFGLTGQAIRITNVQFFLMEDCLFQGGTDGIVWFGSTNLAWAMATVLFTGFTGTGIDFGTAVLESGTMSTVTLSGTGAGDVALSGATGSANVATGHKIKVLDCSTNGTTTPLSGIASNDAQWVFRANTGIPDTSQAGSLYLANYGSATVISAANTPVKTNGGTSWVAGEEHQFSVNTNGRLTYDGVDTVDFMAVATVGGTGSSGTNTFTFYLAKNGVVNNASRAPREFASTADGALTVIGIQSLDPGDYLELWVENNSGATNFELKDANIVVRV